MPYLLPNLYGYLTALDSCLHRDEIFEKAVNSKYDIILDIAPSIKYGLFNVDIKKLKELGYVIHYHILAVDIKQSLVSVFERYENQLEGKSENIKVPNVERLLNWVLSNEGQEIIEKTGYVGINK